MIAFRSIFSIGGLSLFRTGGSVANRGFNGRLTQMRKSNFHLCITSYAKDEKPVCTTEELPELCDESDGETQPKRSLKNSPLRQPFAKLTGRYQLVYTCKKCNTRNTATISKTAYHHGAVVASCHGCKANHLIADNLKWYGENKTNIEDILKEKGESVTKITAHDLFLEVVPPDAPDLVSKEEMKKLPPLSI